MYSNIIATLVHIVLAVTLAIEFEMGMKGVAIATSFHFFTRFLVTVSYIKFSGKFDGAEHQVAFSDPECFRHWGAQFKQSLQCMSMSVWSWWAMDIFTIIASYMPQDELTAQTIMR